MNELDVILSMQDDEFKVIIENDEIINKLEKQKYNPALQFNELMAILSKIYKVNGIVVQAITPAVWSYLYCIGNAYTIQGKEIEKIDTDIFMYVISNGITNLGDDLVLSASGFCLKNDIDYIETMLDIKNFIHLAFRPLEMLSYYDNPCTDEVRFNADWLTKIVSVVAPLTNKESNDIIFNMSLTECFYYMIQHARQFDDKNLIKRRNTIEIEAEIYKRTLELGKQYYQDKYMR